MRQSIALAVLVLLGLPAGASAATLGEQGVLMLTTWGPEPYAPATIRGSPLTGGTGPLTSGGALGCRRADPRRAALRGAA